MRVEHARRVDSMTVRIYARIPDISSSWSSIPSECKRSECSWKENLLKGTFPAQCFLVSWVYGGQSGKSVCPLCIGIYDSRSRGSRRLRDVLVTFGKRLRGFRKNEALVIRSFSPGFGTKKAELFLTSTAAKSRVSRFLSFIRR